MNKMSEDEAIKLINDIKKEYGTMDALGEYVIAIETILDLYQHKKGRIDELKQELLQEKEKNKELEEKIKEKIKEKLKQNKAKTDCKYCNNTCASYATCIFCKELLEDN